MDIRAEDVRNLIKKFFVSSFNFFNKRYQRRRAVNNVDDFENFPETLLQNIEALFVLSTGRCGTDFLNHTLKRYDPLDVQHEGDIKLAIASRYLYEYKNEINQKGGELSFLAGRYQNLQDAYLFHKTYVETNNRLTFFSPYIENLMPRARFIHLVRHPGDFVRSGMRRGYYIPDRIADYTKIRPVATDDVYNIWETYSRMEKISWLWNQTNKFIEKFKEKHPEKVLLIKSELLFENPRKAISLVGNFLGYDTVKTVKYSVGPKNVQKSGSFPRYENWSLEEKEKMKAIVGELAAKYDYQL